MAIDIIARGMIESSNGNISQLSEKVSNHTDNSDIHVTVSDKENWNSHPNDITAKGNPVQLDGLQGGVPFSEIAVSGKNLTGNTIISTTGNPVVSDNDDNWELEWSGGFGIRFSDIDVKPNAEYTLKYAQKATNGTDAIRAMIIDADTSATIAEQSTVNAKTGTEYTDNIFTFNSGTAKHIYIRVVRSTSTGKATLSNAIQLELGNTATEYEPPITGRELTVSVCGKNLLPAMSNSVTRNGITYTVNADGTITLNGTAEKAGGVDVITKTPLKAGVYTLSGCPEGGSGTSFALRAGLGTTNTLYGRDYGNGLKITAETDTVITVTIQNVEIGRVFDNLVFRPQLELGDTATEFEPYHGAEYTVTPDSNPYTVPNDIRQQDGLNTISVSAGTLSVTGVRKNAAIKRIWDEIDEIKTAIIVSNGESE